MLLRDFNAKIASQQVKLIDLEDLIKPQESAWKELWISKGECYSIWPLLIGSRASLWSGHSQ